MPTITLNDVTPLADTELLDAVEAILLGFGGTIVLSRQVFKDGLGQVTYKVGVTGDTTTYGSLREMLGRVVAQRTVQRLTV